MQEVEEGESLASPALEKKVPNVLRQAYSFPKFTSNMYIVGYFQFYCLIFPHLQDNICGITHFNVAQGKSITCCTPVSCAWPTYQYSVILAQLG